MKGYKAFDKDLKCRDVQFEVGKETKVSGKVELCKNGIHFCEKLSSVFEYYPKNYDTRVCEIEASGEILTEGNKSCSEIIKIIRELSKEEIKSLTGDLKFNSGDYNGGHYNSGDYNSGHYNSGHYNIGDNNSGDNNVGNYNSGDNNGGHYNSGDNNSGHYNIGDNNSGDNNVGNYNSGDNNGGHYNSGNYNSGDNNSGYFNTVKSKIKLFNKDSDLFHDSEIVIKLNNIIHKYWRQHLTYVFTKDMTQLEKINNPSHSTTGGFLRLEANTSYKKSWKKVWIRCSENERDFIKKLPNFDAEVFLDITGIDVKIEEIEIVVSGVIKNISKELAKQLGLI